MHYRYTFPLSLFFAVFLLVSIIPAPLFAVEEPGRTARQDPLPRTRNMYTGTWELGAWTGVSATTTQQGSTVVVSESADVAQHYVQQYIDVPSSQWWKLALTVTPVGARNLQLYILDANNQSASSVSVQCGLTGAGSILSKSAGSGSVLDVTTVVANANGSYTCTVSGQLTSGTAPTRLRLIAYALSGSSSQYQGDGSSGFKIHSAVLSGSIPAASCSTKAYATCPSVQSLLSMREGFGAATTGGLGGDIVTVTNLNDSGPGSLRAALTLLPSTKPVWVKFAPGLSGTIALQSQLAIPTNRTLDGRDANISLSGRGIKLFGNHGASNVIVSNISVGGIVDSSDDAITIANGAKNIWVHRAELKGPGGDGLLDVTGGATDITVSWSKFLNHDKVMIVNTYETGVLNGVEVLNGHELDFYDRDKDARVTLHHNVFNSTGQRHPRAVFGKVHMYNNLLSQWGSYGIGASFRSQVLAEGNVLEHTGAYGIKALLTQVGIDPEHGFARLLNNLFTGTVQASSFMPDSVFEVPYQYRCTLAQESLKTALLAQAGPLTRDVTINTTPLSSGCPAVVTTPPPPAPEWQAVTLGYWTPGNAAWTASDTGGSLTENSTNSTHSIQQYLVVSTTTSPFRLSFEAKPRGERDMRIYVFDSSNQSLAYLAAQCVLSGQGSIRSSWKGTLATGLAASAEALTDGWYKCTLSGTPSTAGLAGLRLVLQLEQNGTPGYTGDGASGVDLRAILLEKQI